MAAGGVFDSDGGELADEVVVVGDDDCLFFEPGAEAVVEFAAQVEEVFGVGGAVAYIYTFYDCVVEFVEPVDYACANAYFVDADYLRVVFGDSFYDESGCSHGVEFLVLGEGYYVVSLSYADDCTVGAEAGYVYAYVDGGCEV